jgi:hypothetical protein
MKRKFFSPDILKIGILIMLLLNFLMITIRSANASPDNIFSIKTETEEYLRMAKDAIKAEKWVDAAINYSIYFDRKSQDPANSKWVTDTKPKLKNIVFNAQLDQRIAMVVRKNNLETSCSQAMVAEYREVQANKDPMPVSLLNIGPAPDEIWVFTEPNFQGTWESLTIGNYYTPAEMRMDDNSISSVMVGSEVRAHFCNDSYLNGDCMVFVPVPNHHPNLANNIIGDNNVTSIRVVPKGSCQPASDEVTLFMHIDYGEPCQKLKVGQYNNSDQFNLPDNSISSISLGSGVRTYLCSDNSLRGTCEWINFNDPWLGDNGVGNDTLSSLKVEFKP